MRNVPLPILGQDERECRCSEKAHPNLFSLINRDLNGGLLISTPMNHPRPSPSYFLLNRNQSPFYFLLTVPCTSSHTPPHMSASPPPFPLSFPLLGRHSPVSPLCTEGRTCCRSLTARYQFLIPPHNTHPSLQPTSTFLCLKKWLDLFTTSNPPTQALIFVRFPSIVIDVHRFLISIIIDSH